VERVAIVGTGIAGLGCAWNLREQARITLFEQDTRPGGHTNTVTVDEDGADVPIDTGFIVFNKVTYPHLCRLFDELGVEIQPSEMSFSVQHVPDGLEYNGMSLARIFAQKRNLLRPRFHRLLGEIGRFFKIANATLESAADCSVREFAERNGFGRDFLDHYLVPMSAAIWSSQPGEALDFPAGMLVRFFHNHGFLGVRTHHPWFTVSRGARSYVGRILRSAGELRLDARVVAIEEGNDGVLVRCADCAAAEFDRVVVATHADQALRLLGDPSDEDRAALAGFGYTENEAVLHTDRTLLPRAHRVRSSWNYLLGDDGRPTITYWLNRLQRLDTDVDYCVTLNAPVRDEATIARFRYAHPLYTAETPRLQARLRRLSGERNTVFAGAHLGNGFHEAGLASGVEAAVRLGVVW
jgi:predicted NAD/FAD-binding protein